MSDSILLSNGKCVELRKLKGRDYIEAQRPLSDKSNQLELGFSLLARRCVIDGKQAIFEDILDLDEADLNLLMTVAAEAAGGAANFTQSIPQQ